MKRMKSSAMRKSEKLINPRTGRAFAGTLVRHETVVSYYGVNIVRVDGDGNVFVSTGGYHDRETRRRINAAFQVLDIPLFVKSFAHDGATDLFMKTDKLHPIARLWDDETFRVPVRTFRPDVDCAT
jgi:hypothetical protein